MVDEFLSHAGALWLALALLLGLTELLLPGLYLVFFAVGALATGITVLVGPDLPVTWQAVSMIVWSGLTLSIARRWYHQAPAVAGEALLNDRGARLIGATVEVCEPLREGHGRVRVGDGSWLANGPDAPMGAPMRVIGARDGTLMVTPVDRPTRP